MINLLVETKQEYTTQLINVLTPLIYEGIQSIYIEVLEISIPDNILKNLQSALKKIPTWNNDTINNETNRIMNNSKSFSWLEDLIKATIKSNIIVLTYNPCQEQVKLDPNHYQNIKINDFIHKIYIECAREIWNNPYLLYHKYPPIELKRNQRDTMILIKDCIKEAIRKCLPLKHILNIYLGEDVSYGTIDIDKSISEVEQQNLSKLINKDKLINNDYKQYNNEVLTLDYKSPNKYTNSINPPNFSNTINPNNTINKESNVLTKSNETVGSKILGIINKINLTDNLSDANLTANKNNYQEIFSNGSINNNINSIKPIENKDKFFNKYLN